MTLRPDLASTSKDEDLRAYVAEKRRIYAAFNSAIEHLSFVVTSPQDFTTDAGRSSYNDGMTALWSAYYEVSLIAPSAIERSARDLTDALTEFGAARLKDRTSDEPEEFDETRKLFVDDMRTDLDKYTPVSDEVSLGLCALQAGEYPRAISAFRSAIERNPRFPDAFNNMGVAHDRLGELTQAMECFRCAVALHPDHADALRNLGDALMRSGNAADAVSAFRRAAELRPREATAHAELGAAQLSAGDLPAARDSLGRALKLDGRLVGAAVHLGEALRLQEDFAGATVAFERALQVDASCAAAHLGLGRLASLRGNAEAALHHLVAAGGGIATSDPQPRDVPRRRIGKSRVGRPGL